MPLPAPIPIPQPPTPGPKFPCSAIPPWEIEERRQRIENTKRLIAAKKLRRTTLEGDRRTHLPILADESAEQSLWQVIRKDNRHKSEQEARERQAEEERKAKDKDKLLPKLFSAIMKK